MPITAEDIQKAFGCFNDRTEKGDGDRVELDLLKVAITIGDEISAMMGDENPVEKFESFEGKLEKIEALLQKADFDPETQVSTVEFGVDLVDEFSVQKDETTTDVDTTEDTDDDVNKKEDEKVILDADGWGHDMAPGRPPTTRTERLTKGEIAITSRSDGSHRDRVRKAREVREKALAKRDGYVGRTCW